MTARSIYNDTLELSSTAGENPHEVLKDYIQEVERLGHEIKESIAPLMRGLPMRHDRTMFCAGCNQTMRVYFVGEMLHVFSDFFEHQCTRRQMNVLSLMRR